MAETSFTYQQVQELIKAAVETAVLASNKMNPIEQRKFDQETEKEDRRNQMMIQLGKIEEESNRRRKDGCTHRRYNMSNEKHAGEMAPKEATDATWSTGGQAYQNGLACLVCTRCQNVWMFRP